VTWRLPNASFLPRGALEATTYLISLALYKVLWGPLLPFFFATIARYLFLRPEKMGPTYDKTL
jgi:hypothetical protein